MWSDRLSEISDDRPLARALWMTIAALLSLLFLCVRAINIDHPELWLDESSTYGVAIHPLRDLFTLPTSFHSQPPLYYFVLHFLIKLSSERWVIRGLSWLCCFALVEFVLFFADELSLFARVFFCLLFLYSDVAHYLVTTLRPYGMAVLFTLLSSVALVRLLRAPSRRAAIAYAVLTLAMLYTMAFDVGVFVAHGVFLALVWVVDLARHRWRAALARQKYSLCAAAACVIGYLPYLLLAVHYQYKTNQTSTLHYVAKLDIYTSALQEHFGMGTPGMTLVYALAVLAIVAGLCARDATVLLWPLIAVIQIAFVWVFIYGRSAVGVQGRYMTPAFISVAFLAALGAQRLIAVTSRATWVVLLFLLTYLAIPAVKQFHAYMHAPLPVGKWETLRREIKKQPGHKVVFFEIGYAGQDFEYVIRRDRDIEAATARGPGWAAGGDSYLATEYITGTIDRTISNTHCYYYWGSQKGQYAAVLAPTLTRLGFKPVAAIGDTYGFCK